VFLMVSLSLLGSGEYLTVVFAGSDEEEYDE
jgi:hypothetical protein